MAEWLTRGNVICRYYCSYLDSVFIPGEFTHSGLIVNPDQIIHSIAEGVGIVHPIDFVKDTDGFIILRPPYATHDAIEKAASRAHWHLDNGTQYDFSFNDPSKFYCHEFTVDCLMSGGIEGIPLVKKSFGVFPFRFERELYLADAIIQKCSTEYAFRGRYRKGIGETLASSRREMAGIKGGSK
jgi:hypothetical protein